MSRYRKVSLSMYSDAKFRSLSRPQPNGQSLWLWLLTGPMTTVIPGLIVSGPAGMAERIGWPLEGFRKAFSEVTEQGMAKADFDSHLVWLPKAIEHNKPQSPNVVKSWGEAWLEIPECDLKAEAYQYLRSFLEGLGDAYLKAFYEVCGKPSGKPLLNQEQEQEQEVEPSLRSGSAPSDDAPLDAPTADLPIKTSRSGPADDPVVEVIPLVGDDEHPVTESDLAEYERLYPAVDVRQEIRSMRGWSLANPKRRKKPNGAKRFITNWLTDKQNKGGNTPNGGPHGPTHSGHHAARPQSAAERFWARRQGEVVGHG